MNRTVFLLPLIVVLGMMFASRPSKTTDSASNNASKDATTGNQSELNPVTKYAEITKFKGARIRIRGIPAVSKNPHFLILDDGKIEWEDPEPEKHGLGRKFESPVILDADVEFVIPPARKRGEIQLQDGLILPEPQQVERENEGYFLLRNCKLLREN